MEIGSSLKAFDCLSRCPGILADRNKRGSDGVNCGPLYQLSKLKITFSNFHKQRSTATIETENLAVCCVSSEYLPFLTFRHQSERDNTEATIDQSKSQI